MWLRSRGVNDIYEPGGNATINRPLRRTLVRSVILTIKITSSPYWFQAITKLQSADPCCVGMAGNSSTGVNFTIDASQAYLCLLISWLYSCCF